MTVVSNIVYAPMFVHIGNTFTAPAHTLTYIVTYNDT